MRTLRWLTWFDEPFYPELPLKGIHFWLEKQKFRSVTKCSLLCHCKQVRSTLTCDARPPFLSAQRPPHPWEQRQAGTGASE